ncbi:hypothetical protein [Streptomyces murinus]|uniref:hypothetical protein n=1 Tax=Streptomyces murinus TaxID=33900 RepID=UPI0018F6E6FD|nr:hypothetical protein [Streptomyces murinus]
MTTPDYLILNPTPITPEITSDQPFEISGQDMALLLPWMRATLATQDRYDDNSDLCQTLSSIFRKASEVYGTKPFTRDQCVCRG